jgi:hypothetical protein
VFTGLLSIAHDGRVNLNRFQLDLWGAASVDFGGHSTTTNDGLGTRTQVRGAGNRHPVATCERMEKIGVNQAAVIRYGSEPTGTATSGARCLYSVSITKR